MDHLVEFMIPYKIRQVKNILGIVVLSKRLAQFLESIIILKRASIFSVK